MSSERDRTRVEPDFRGRIALVTGSTRGIGRAIAAELVAAGASVVVHGTRDADARGAAADLGAATGVGADLADADAVRALVDTVESGIGPVDILVNNAAVSIRRTFLETDATVWEQTLAVDLLAPITLLQATLPGMVERRWGRILNVASAAGVEPTPQFAAYATAKGGLVTLTLTLAAELRRSGITVNALSPIGMTDMLRQLPSDTLDHLVGLGVPTVERCALHALELLGDDAPSGAHLMMEFGEG